MEKLEYFGTDGIRAEYGTFPLVPDFVLKLGAAAGDVLRQGRRGGEIVVVGRDTRRSGPILQAALTSGLLATGVSVLDVGVVTTPGVAYLMRRLGAVAGVVLSASHNPVNENGIKFFGPDGFKLPEPIELEIEQRLRDDYRPTYKHEAGRSIDGRGMHEFYVEDLVSEHPDLCLDELKLVMDCANGAASFLAPEALSRLGANLTVINASPTGLNINDRAGSEFVRRRPDMLGELIRHYGADFGLAFDGDADRVVFVDERGDVVDGDHMIAILADYFHRQGRLAANAAVTTTMRNEGLVRFLDSRQIKVYETPVGDKYVGDKLRELSNNWTEKGFGVGGEQAGHVALMDRNHTTGDGIRTALYLTRVYVESGARSLSELASVVNKTPQFIASAYVGRGPRLDRTALDELQREYAAKLPGLARINLRYSGTEPQFRAMMEADSSVSDRDLGQALWEICRKVQAAAGTPDGALEILDCARGGVFEPTTT